MILPLAALLITVLTPDREVWEHLLAYVLTDYIVDSALLGAGTVILTLLLGLVPAWLCGVCEFPMRRYLEWLLLLPLAFPPYIVAYIYTGMLDYGGSLHNLLYELFNIRIPIRSMGGAIAVIGFVLYPYTYLLTRAALRRQSTQFIEVGRLLNASPLQVFLRIILPGLRPTLVIASAIVLMETLADYGTVEYFGINTFSVGIIRTWFSLASLEGAAQLSSILLVFVFVLLFVEQASRRAKYHDPGGRPGQRYHRLRGAPAFFAVLFCVIPPLLGFVLPAIQLFVWLPGSLSDWNGFMSLINSFTLAATSAVLLVVISLLLAYSKRILPASLGRRFLIGLATSGYAVPGVVVASGILVLSAGLNFIGVPSSLTLLLSGGLVGVILAYLVRYLTLSFNAIDTALDKIPPNLDDAARTLGAKTMQLFTRVHIPLMKSGIFAAFLLTFVEVIKELPATLVLRPFNFNTLAIQIYELASDERLSDIAPYALCLVVIGLLPILIIVRSVKNL